MRLNSKAKSAIVDLKSPAADCASLQSSLGLSRVTSHVLYHRGIRTAEQAKSFLNPSLREHLPDPSNILNLDAAAAKMIDAVHERKRMTVYSDFDVDRISAGAQLASYLRMLGGLVNHYTPNRFTEGYGLISSAVEKLAAAKTELLITVDCGISSKAEIALARRLGMETIVIDHHQVHEIPPADIVVDPEQEGCSFRQYKLCAAGLVWMLLIALRREASRRLSTEQLPDPKEFLDLAALGTICDMVPLQGVNRLIAHRGVEALRVTERPGLKALKEISGIGARFNAGHVGFQLGPRINAAGRLSDAREVFELLTTTSIDKARNIAERINRLNGERQRLEEELKEVCIGKIEAEGLLDSPAFAIFDISFHVGVIGIVAQRLVEAFYRPAAVMAPGEATVKGNTERIIKGSVRSVPGFNVAEVLSRLSDLLIGHGGHREAGGFSVAYENLEKFQRAFTEEAEKLLPPEKRVRRIEADVEVSLGEIDFDCVQELERLQPFGVGNPSPVLVVKDVYLDSVTPIGDRHLKLRVVEGKYSLNALAWRFQGNTLLKKGEQVNLAFTPEIHTYQGLSSVQLNVREVWK